MQEPGDSPMSEEAIGAINEQQTLSGEDPHGWGPEAYIKAVELTDNEGLKEYMQEEKKFISDEVQDSSDKTFVDIGAGYGRVLRHLAEQAGKVINIEMDDDMFSWLSQRCADYPNSIAVKGDANQLEAVLEGQDVENPVLLSLQNTLGTWQGDRNVALDAMRSLAESKKGEIIISLFCKEALRDFGIGMYQRIYEQSKGELSTEPDLDNTDFESGTFRAKIGRENQKYESHWFSKEEREAMKERLGGELAGELETPNFHIFHIKYS